MCNNLYDEFKMLMIGNNFYDYDNDLKMEKKYQ